MEKENPSRKNVDLSFLKVRWPSSIVARSQVVNFTGGSLSENVMRRLDQQGAGPTRLKIGNRVVYPIDDFIKWLEKRTVEDKG